MFHTATTEECSKHRLVHTHAKTRKQTHTPNVNFYEKSFYMKNKPTWVNTMFKLVNAFDNNIYIYIYIIYILIYFSNIKNAVFFFDCSEVLFLCELANVDLSQIRSWYLI